MLSVQNFCNRFDSDVHYSAVCLSPNAVNIRFMKAVLFQMTPP
jgi:hypothetical protein